MTNDSTVIDADFTNASNLETLTTSANSNLTATLGANASAAGIATVTFADVTGNDSLTISSGFTKALTVNFDLDDTNVNSVVATNYTGALTVKAGSTTLDSAASTITGGTGTSDSIEVTHTTSETLLLGSTTNIETIKLISDGLSAWTSTITTVDALVAENKSLTIDGRNLDDGTNDGILAFDGSAETDGTFTVLVDGTTAHQITLGAKNDTFTDTGSGAIAVTATGGTNTITMGTGAGTVTAGSGTDTIAGGTGSDTFKFTSAANSNGDSITDFVSADDQLAITLDYSALAAVTVNATRTGAGVAGVTNAEATMTGARGEFVYDTTNSKLLMDLTGDGAISGADHSIAINAATTAANTIAATDIDFTITTGGGADVITTGPGADNITGGAGADTITAGTGVDTIAVGTGAGDTVIFTEILDGLSALVTVSHTTGTNDDFTATAGTTVDSITSDWDLNDFIKIDGNLEAALEASAARTLIANGAANLNFNATGVAILTGTKATLAGDNFGDVSAVIAAFETGTAIASNGAVGDEILFTLEGSTANLTGLYYFKNSNTDSTISNGDTLALLAIIADDTIIASDIIV